WVIDNPLSTPAVLPLADLNLALRGGAWDDRPALAGDFDGKTPGLLVEEGGTRTASFAWSLRGEQEGHDLRFTLQTPACTVATLRLTLPADTAVTVPRGGALVTALPGKSKEVRDWHVGFAGKSRVELVLRRADAPGQKTLLVSHVS